MSLPGKDYIIYTQQSNSPYWEKIRSGGENYLNSINSFSKLGKDELADTASFLITLGNQERQKEIQLINMATGINNFYTDDLAGTKQFIKDFNEIIMGKDQFKYALDRIKASLNNSSKKTSDTSQRAPTIASWFTSYFRTNLSKNMQAFINKSKDSFNNIDFSSWDSQFTSIVQKSIDGAMKQMFTEVNKQDASYGDKEQWTALYEGYNTILGFKSKFYDMINRELNLDSLKAKFKKQYDSQLKAKQNNKTHKGTTKFIDQTLNLSSGKKSRSIGGNVQEYVLDIIYSTLGGTSIKISDKGSTVITNKKAITDGAIIYSFEQELSFDAQKMVDLLNTELLDTQDLLDASNKMDNFWNKYLSKLNNSFIVYSNAKSYSLSSSFRGFGGGGQRSMKYAESILMENGISNASDLIVCAYNTMNGAVLSGSKNVILENLKANLAKSMANLLFDDWKTIGSQESGTNALHVLTLEGIQIPLSAFLIAAGRAMQDVSNFSTSYFKVNIKLPTEVKYPVPISGLKTEGHLTNMDIWDAWEDQRQIAINNSGFEVKFLKNFKNLIAQFLE